MKTDDERVMSAWLVRCFGVSVLLGMYCGGIAFGQGLGNCKKCDPTAFRAVCATSCTDSLRCTGTVKTCLGNTPLASSYYCVRKQNYSCSPKKCDGKCKDDGVTPCKCTAAGC